MPIYTLGTPTLTSVPIRLLQWNVWMEESVDRILEVLEDLNPDIACLQEVTAVPGDRPELLTRASAELGLSGVFAPAHAIPIQDRLRVRGNAVIGKAHHTSIPLTPFRAFTDGVLDDEHQGRAFASATFATDPPITALSVHLSYVPEFAAPPWKLAEFDALCTEAEGRRGFVLAGDMNAAPDSPGIARLRKVLHDAGPDEALPTWTTKPFDDGTFAETRLAWRLDHVLLSPDLRVVGAQIIDTDVSDHLPILVTLEGTP